MTQRRAPSSRFPTDPRRPTKHQVPSSSANDAAVTEFPVDPRGSIGALGLGVNSLDLLGQLGVGDCPGGGGTGSALVVGGTGDLEQATCLLDAVTCNLLPLDEGVRLHRVSLA